MTSFHRRNHCLISLLRLVSEQEPISILVTQEGLAQTLLQFCVEVTNGISVSRILPGMVCERRPTQALQQEPLLPLMSPQMAAQGTICPTPCRFC